MAIEDRVRDGLRRSAAQVRGEEQLREDLWLGIGRGIQRARRRQATMHVATVGFILAVFAGIMAWVVIGFVGSGRQVADRRNELSVQRVQVFGTKDGLAKIHGTVSNHGPRAVGAKVDCQVFDAGEHLLGTGSSSLPYVPAGASQPFGIGGRYPGTPSSARCTVAPIPPVAPSPGQPTGAGFQPSAVAFWNPRDGILAGSVGEPACFPSCIWFLERTSDGGRTWQKVLQPEDFVYDVAVYGSSDAWALTGPCAMGTCQIHVLFSNDGGRTWHQRSTTDLKSVSFVSSDDGWGVGNLFPDGSQRIERTSDGGRTWHQRSTTDLKSVSFVSSDDGWGVGNLFPDGSQRIERTSDGGRTWQGRSVPCPHLAATATDVSFLSLTRGWLLCTGAGGAGIENRAILETTDAGRTWTIVAEANLGGRSSSGLTAPGYPNGIAFLPDGHGWMWAERSVGIEATTDGGHSWHVVGKVPNGASTSIGSVTFVSDTTGFALLANGDEQANQVIGTLDGGRTWHVVTSWAYESASPTPSRTVIAHGTDAGIAWSLAASKGNDGGISLELDLPGHAAAGHLQGPNGQIPDLWISSVPLETGTNAKTLVFGYVAVRVSSVHIEPTGEIGAVYVIPGQRQVMAFVLVAGHSSNATIVAEDEGGSILAQEPVR
jgi:hypothetical protein